VIWSRKSSGEGRVMSPENAAQVVHMMTEVVATGTGKAARLTERPSAGKTGTTQDYHDAWFIGFTADLVTGVWVGNDDNSGMIKATGGTLPARIFHSFMEDAEAGMPVKPLTALANEPAAAATPTDPTATPATDDKKPSSFDDLLNSLFGAKAATPN
jgi:penicillin-binding protein 1A